MEILSNMSPFHVKPAHYSIVCSKYVWGLFTGSTSSILWIDGMELVY